MHTHGHSLIHTPTCCPLLAVRNFAKLTGDLPALSAVDKRVLALAWMLEKETKGGVAHLRATPPPPRAQGPRQREAPAQDTASEATASEAQGEDVQAGQDEEMADDGEEFEMEDVVDNEPCAVAQGLFLGGVQVFAVVQFRVDSPKNVGMRLTVRSTDAAVSQFVASSVA